MSFSLGQCTNIKWTRVAQCKWRRWLMNSSLLIQSRFQQLTDYPAVCVNAVVSIGQLCDVTHRRAHTCECSNVRLDWISVLESMAMILIWAHTAEFARIYDQLLISNRFLIWRKSSCAYSVHHVRSNALSLYCLNSTPQFGEIHEAKNVTVSLFRTLCTLPAVRRERVSTAVVANIAVRHLNRALCFK